MFDFKGFIDVLRRRARDEHYVGPSATRMMAALPRGESLMALTEIVKSLSAQNRDAKLALKERYRCVLDFDDKARPLIELLARVYRGQEHVEGMSPRQVLPSLLACYQELATAYKVCLKQHAQRPSARYAEEAELMTLRAIGYYALQAKWAYLRYFDTDTKVWRNLNRLYQIADAAGFVNKPLTRYPDEAPCSVAEHYLRAALLRLAEPDRRRPEDIWLVDDWMMHLQSRTKIDRVFRARDQNFAINLDDSRPPMKLRRNMVGERYRYLSTEALASHFADASQMARQGSLPHYMTGVARDHLPAVISLLDDLARVFSRAGQERMRRSERKTAEREVLAAPGLDAMLPLLRGDHTDWAKWTLVDESANGMGAHYKAGYEDRMVVGEVIALRETDGRTFLSAVRRLNKSRDGQVRVGAERICVQPVAVVLIGEAGAHPALFCQDTGWGERALLVRRADWVENAEFTLVAGGKRYKVRLGPQLDQMPDYLLVTFTVLAREAVNAAGQPATGGRQTQT
jgi:hypothetical protein